MFEYIRKQLIDAGVDGPPAGTSIETPVQADDDREADDEEDAEATDDAEDAEGDWEDAPPPTGPELIRMVLESDPEAFIATEGVTPEEWLAWAVSAPPHEWRIAAEAAGMAGAPQPSIYQAPVEFRVAAMQADLDERVAAAQRRR